MKIAKINSYILLITWIIYIAMVFSVSISELNLPLGSDTSGYIAYDIFAFTGIVILLLWSTVTISIYCYKKNKLIALAFFILGIIITSSTFRSRNNYVLAFVNYFPKQVLCSAISLNFSQSCIWIKALNQCRPQLCDKLSVGSYRINECKEKADPESCYALENKRIKEYRANHQDYKLHYPGVKRKSFQSPKNGFLVEWYGCQDFTTGNENAFTVSKYPFTTDNLNRILDYDHRSGKIIEEVDINSIKGSLMKDQASDYPYLIFFNKGDVLIDISGGCSFNTNQMIEIARSLQ